MYASERAELAHDIKLNDNRSNTAWHYVLLSMGILGIAAFVFGIVIFAQNYYSPVGHPLPGYTPYTFSFQGVCNALSVGGSL